jgi:hypothetical protein
MALVQVARFLDICEAQVAAAALRACGMDPLLQGELHGQNLYLLQQALGGYGLWVDEADAADATAFIGEARARPPEPAEAPRRAKSFLAVALGLLFGS